MKNVLVVDDEETLLLIMVNRFEDYADQFNVFTARNGKEAVEVLESESIDFMVTDLKMPEMDGIELLALMSSKYPHIPAMAMSAFSTPEIEKKLAQMGTLRVLDKPVNFDLLADAIMSGLDRSSEGESIRSVSVSSFLQLIKMEDKTCALEVHGENNQRGYIYIKHGDLFDAECDGLSGEQAALEIIAWDSTQLSIKDLPRDKQENKIKKGLMSVVMEGVRRKDERDAAKAAANPQPEVAAGSRATDNESTLQFDLDEPPVAADANPSTVEEDSDLKFDLDDLGLPGETDAAENEMNTDQGSDSKTDPDIPEIAGDAEFGESEESIFGDTQLDFDMDELGLNSDDDADSSGQSVDDDSGLSFELDDFDEPDETENNAVADKEQTAVAAEPAAAEDAALPDLEDVDIGDIQFHDDLDEVDFEPLEDQSEPDDDDTDTFSIDVSGSDSDVKPATEATAADTESKVVKTRPVGSIEKIFRSLNSEQQLNQVLNTVLKTLQKVVPFDLAVLMTRQANNPQYLKIEELVVRGTVKSVQYNRIPFKGAELAAVMKKGKSLIVDDTSLLKGNLEKKMFCQHGLTTCLIIPLSINGSAAGVLTLGARKQGAFSKTRQYVEWVGNGIALALERDRLALDARKQQLALRITEQIGQALIAMKFDINKILKLVLNIVQEQMNTEAGFVYLKSADGLTLTFGTKPDGKAVKKLKLEDEQGIAWQVVKQNGPILVNDMNQLSEEYTEGKDLFKFQTRSVLSVPLVFDEKTIGVIEVRNKREGDYDTGDEILMQSIGVALGIALENARCYKQKKGTGMQEKDFVDSLQKHIARQVEQVPA